MLIIDAEHLSDGLYNIKNGKIFKYKANGGTVRTYKIHEAEPCEDAISRADAIRAIYECELIDSETLDTIHSTEVIQRLFAVRKVAPSRPKGEWIDMGDFEQCSACKGTRLKEFQSYYGKVTWIKTPYCPNCGADMRGADNE